MKQCLTHFIYYFLYIIYLYLFIIVGCTEINLVQFSVLIFSSCRLKNLCQTFFKG